MARRDALLCRPSDELPLVLFLISEIGAEPEVTIIFAHPMPGSRLGLSAALGVRSIELLDGKLGATLPTAWHKVSANQDIEPMTLIKECITIPGKRLPVIQRI